MRALTLYSKPGCHLCDEMKLVIEAVVATIYFRLLMTREDLDDQFLEGLTALLAPGRRARSSASIRSGRSNTSP